MDKKTVFEKFARHVSLKKADFFREVGIDFVFGKREGPFVWDIDGENRLIDCHTNGGVFNLGHRHPEIIQALVEALDEIDIGNHHFVSQEKAELSEILTGLSPEGFSYTIFGVSGGEAIDTAIKIARKAAGRKGIISAQGGYHGHTGLSLAAGDAKFRDPFLSSSADFSQVPFNDLAALEKALNPDTAAVIFETIPATLGMPMPDSDFFTKAKALCEKNGTILIIDEVQTGLGRTGKFWGIEHYQIVPDMIVSAKGLGGGIYPVTATILKTELEAVFHDDPFIHISTTGGADVGCRVARKVLEISSTEGFLSHVNALEAIFADGMAGLCQKYSNVVSEYRQKGLMSGIKTNHADFGPLLSKACFDAGLLCVYAGNDTSVLQFLPPLIIDRSLAAEILQRLDSAMEITAQFID